MLSRLLANSMSFCRSLSGRDFVLALCLTVCALSGISCWKLSTLSDQAHVEVFADAVQASGSLHMSRGFWYGLPAAGNHAPAVWVETTADMDRPVPLLWLSAYAARIAPLLIAGPIWDSYVDPDFNDTTFLWASWTWDPQTLARYILASGAVLVAVLFPFLVGFGFVKKVALFARHAVLAERAYQAKQAQKRRGERGLHEQRKRDLQWRAERTLRRKLKAAEGVPQWRRWYTVHAIKSLHENKLAAMHARMDRQFERRARRRSR